MTISIPSGRSFKATAGLKTAVKDYSEWIPAKEPENILEYWDAWDSTKWILQSGDYASVLGGKNVSPISQTTAAKQPLQVLDEWNGHAVARNSRSASQYLGNSAVPALDTVANVGQGCFVVMAPTAYSVTAYLTSHYAGAGIRLESYLLNATTVRTQANVAGVGNKNQDFTITLGDPFVVFWQVKDNGNRNCWVNGVELSDVAGTVPAAGTHGGTSIGARFNDTIHSDMDWNHIVITPELSDATIVKWSDWAINKFSITV